MMAPSYGLQNARHAGFSLGGLLPQSVHKARPERQRLMRQYGLDGDRRYVAQFGVAVSP